MLTVACALPFSELVSISMLFYGATTLMEFLALLRLRKLEPLTPRPFRVPCGYSPLLLACVPPIFLCILLICLAPVEAWLFFSFATSLGVLSYTCRVRPTLRLLFSWRPELALSGYGAVTSAAPSGLDHHDVEPARPARPCPAEVAVPRPDDGTELAGHGLGDGELSPLEMTRKTLLTRA